MGKGKRWCGFVYLAFLAFVVGGVWIEMLFLVLLGGVVYILDEI
jgi:hypothetical protein